MSAINLASKLGENLIINPLVDIWQRGTSFSNLGSGIYGPDRFRTSTNAATMRINIARSTDVPTDSFANYSSRLTLNSAPAAIGASEFYGYIQQIEGYNARKIYNKNAYFVMFIKSSVTGYFALSIGTSAGDQRFSSRVNITQANTWTKIKIPVKKIETSLGGTFEKTNSAGLYASLILSAGASAVVDNENTWFLDGGTKLGIAGQIDFGNSSGIEVYTTQWQLHEGIDEIPYHQLHRDFGTEVELCQRYYELMNGSIFGTQAGANYVAWFFKQGKRVVPVLTGALYGSSSVANIGTERVLYTSAVANYAGVSNPTADAEL